MALFSLQPTKLDQLVADAVVAHTSPAIERAARLITWAGDEHLLCVAAALFWLAARRSPRRRRELSDHILLGTLAATALPHVIKAAVDQERPDRRTAVGQRGISKSGKRYDAFPSGHSVHVGMLAGAAELFPPPVRTTVWAAGTVVAATRVVMLAHWPSDVAAGLAIGAVLERLLRPLSLSRSPGVNARQTMLDGRTLAAFGLKR